MESAADSSNPATRRELSGAASAESCRTTLLSIYSIPSASYGLTFFGNQLPRFMGVDSFCLPNRTEIRSGPPGAFVQGFRPEGPAGVVYLIPIKSVLDNPLEPVQALSFFSMAARPVWSSSNCSNLMLLLSKAWYKTAPSTSAGTGQSIR